MYNEQEALHHDTIVCKNEKFYQVNSRLRLVDG